MGDGGLAVHTGLSLCDAYPWQIICRFKSLFHVQCRLAKAMPMRNRREEQSLIPWA